MWSLLRRPVICLLAAVLAGGTHGSAFAVDQLLRITEVMSKPSDRYAASDWFELTNFGTQRVDLSFYAVDDNTFAGQLSAFLNSVDGSPIFINPGESVVFVEGDSATVAGFRSSWGLGSDVQVGYYGGSGLSFSSGGDGTTVFDEQEPPQELPGPFGGLIRVSYPAATTGRSFFWEYTADGALGSISAGTVTPTTDEDPFSMSWTYTLSDGVTTETQYATPGKSNAATQAIGILIWSGNDGSGGAGTWTSPNPLTWRENGSPVAWNASSIATFPATNPTAGTVTLVEPVVAAELDFGKTGYTIAAADPSHTLSLNSGIINVATSVTATINTAIDGPVGLTKTGQGTLLLGGANQYNGLTSITFGEVRLTGAGQLPASSVVSVGLTGVLNLNGRSTTIGGLQGLGDVQMGGGTLTIGIADDTDREHNGNLSGSGDVIVDSVGAGEQRFDLRTSTASKRKSYTGRTIVREGSLRVSLESIPDQTSGVEVEEGGRLKLSTSAATGSYLFGEQGENSLWTTVSLLGGTLTNAEGEITALANDMVFGGSVASRLEVNQENDPTPDNPNVAELRLMGALTGNGAVSVVGNGTVSLGTTASQVGTPTDYSGVFTVGDAAAVGETTLLNLTGSIGTGSIVVNAGGAVQAAVGVPFTARAVELAGGELRLDAGPDDATTFEQTTVTVTADSSMAVRRADDVAAELSPTYDPFLTLAGGRLTVTAPTKSATDVSAYEARPTFSGAITLGQDATVSVVNPAAGTNRTTFSGIVADGGGGKSLTKRGDGTLVLAAANTYGGQTLVEEGSLALAATGAVAGSARVAVAAGATFDVSAKAGGYVVPATQTLAGNGTVAGSVTVGGGATLAPGASPGTLTVTGNTTFGAGGQYNWQVLDFGGEAGSASGWDLLSVGGSLDVTATSASPFAINLWSLSSTGPDVSGPATGWNSGQNGSWRIATAAGGITGFAADKFAVNTAAANGTAGFANGQDGGSFTVEQQGNDLVLRFAAAGGPEPVMPVKVAGVYVKGSAWNAGYLARSPFSTVEGSAAGWKLPDGAMQLADASNVSWNNVNTITVEFDQPISQPAAAALQLVRGTSTGNETIVPALAPTLLGDGSAAQWNLPAALDTGRYVMSIAADGIRNADGTAGLDGEWVTGASTFLAGSGDGVEGGTFNFLFNALVGDVNGNGVMNGNDISAIRSSMLSSLTTPLATDALYRLDINGSNGLGSTDLSQTRAELTSSLGTRLSSLPTVTVPGSLGGASLGVLGTDGTIAAVPEPGALGLVAAGAAIALALRLRREKYPTSRAARQWV